MFSLEDRSLCIDQSQAKMDEQVTDVQKVAEPYGWKIVQCKLLKLT